MGAVIYALEYPPLRWDCTLLRFVVLRFMSKP